MKTKEEVIEFIKDKGIRLDVSLDKRLKLKEALEYLGQRIYSDSLAFDIRSNIKYLAFAGCWYGCGVVSDKTTINQSKVIELVENLKNKGKQMKKSDLKTGMFVVLASGDEGIILGNAVVSFSSKVGGISLKCYQDNLTHTSSTDRDIIEVHAEASCCAGASLNYYVSYPDELKGKLLWKREEEVKEVTMDDLEKQFGCKVKIVK